MINNKGIPHEERQLIHILELIDEEATLSLGDIPTSEKPCVVIVGGGAFVLRDLTSRPSTHDIDVFMVDERLREIISHYPEVNSAVMAYMDSIPYNFEDRLVQIPIQTTTIVFKTPSIEDLAVMKLYGWRPNDKADLTNNRFLEQVNWDLLDRLIYDEGESKASAITPRRYEEMVFTYEQYRKEYRK